MDSYRSFETFRLVLTEFSGSNNYPIQKLHACITYVGLLSFGDSVITMSKNCKHYESCCLEDLHWLQSRKRKHVLFSYGLEINNKRKQKP